MEEELKSSILISFFSQTFSLNFPTTFPTVRAILNNNFSPHKKKRIFMSPLRNQWTMCMARANFVYSSLPRSCAFFSPQSAALKLLSNFAELD